MRIVQLTFLALCVSALMPYAAHAESVDDIVTLAQKNVGEDVLLATVNNSKSDFNLSAQDIIKLKNANVPNPVITAMLKHRGVSVASAPVPAPAPAPAAAPNPAPAPAPIAAGEGTLDLENLDNRAWSYRYEPAVGTLWIVPAEKSGRIPASGNIALRMKSGTYYVRFSGSNEPGATFNLYPNGKSEVLISRVNTDQLEALYYSVFENGEKKSGGRLAVLRDGSIAAQNPPPAVVTPSTDYVSPAPPVVAAPQTTVIYRDPVYVAPPPVIYAPGYYRPYYYYPRSTVNFGYFHGGRHSSVGVGLGFGF